MSALQEQYDKTTDPLACYLEYFAWHGAYTLHWSPDYVRPDWPQDREPLEVRIVTEHIQAEPLPPRGCTDGEFDCEADLRREQQQVQLQELLSFTRKEVK